MSNPLSVLPLAMAAHGGTLDGIPSAQLVAAGLTLLQRAPSLPRALYGKRAAILMPTCPQFVSALAACDGRGAVLLNPLDSALEIAAQLCDSDVGAVFTLAALAERLPSALPIVLLDDAPHQASVLRDGTVSTIDLGSHTGLELEGDDDADGSDEEAVVVYTSAMHGRSLGAILTHRNLFAGARGIIDAMQLTSGDHLLAALPFGHLLGLSTTLIAPLLAGARITTMARIHPREALDALIEGGVTVFVGVPSVFIAMLTAIERRGGTIDAPALRVCVCSGAALPVWVQRKWEAATGCALRQAYGVTEASSVCLINRTDRPNHIGTLGMATAGADVSVRNPTTGGELPVGSSGEICVRGPTVSPGYVSNAAHGLRRTDDWLHTGDQGHIDADGIVTFEGLIKPMFTRNGFNIYPEELVRVIGEMSGVTRVEVLGVPEMAKENEIDVIVHGSVESASVLAWCAERLSAYKQPTRITLVA